MVRFLLCALVLKEIVMRTCLTADLDLYIADGGKDTNDGSRSQPLATMLHAWQVTRDSIDLCGHAVRFNLLTGLIESPTLEGPFTGQVKAEDVSFVGAGPSTTSLRAQPNGFNFYAREEARFAVTGVTLGGGDMGIVVEAGSVKAGAIWFDAMSVCVDTAGPRARFTGIGDLTFLFKNFRAAFVAEDHSQIELPCGLVISGAPNFSGAFVQADLGAMIDATNAKVAPGSATGQRYHAYSLGIVFTGGSGGPNFFPGNKPGDVNGGLYY
jgi:hypothetical protein